MQTINRIQAVRVRAWIATLTPISRPSPTAVGREGGALVLAQQMTITKHASELNNVHNAKRRDKHQETS